MSKIEEKVSILVTNLINSVNKNNEEIKNALNTLLGNNFYKYHFDNNNNFNIDINDFQNQMAHVNEKSSKQKDNGVYYTPADVTRFIIINTYINRLYKDNNKAYEYNDGIKKILQINDKEMQRLLFSYSVIDPTCGTGEFIINVLQLKEDILKKTNLLNDKNIISIAKTIYGNDIDEESSDICKLRSFFKLVYLLNEKNNIKKLAKAINGQYYNVDFIEEPSKLDEKFDIIIGNPPYVEYGKYNWKGTHLNSYGNVYADVINNSIDIMTKDGTFGFIIPLSYVSTPRMKSIREQVYQNTEKQFVFSYADRPDCLFTGVHQKLNIVIARKGSRKHEIYTSNYKHWYKNERNTLLTKVETINNIKGLDDFIPKLGNRIESSIFDKVYTTDTNNLYDMQAKSNDKIYLNMRACFWVKAFTFNPGSNEYKEFEYTKSDRDFVLCVLNSSLFWIYWTIMSDCWHITSKELKNFYLPPEKVDSKIFHELAQKLEQKLETTKKFVGTKQVEYEYKHRLCKDVIDEIDGQLAKLYQLSQDELDYIKDFAINYRVGGEVNVKNN